MTSCRLRVLILSGMAFSCSVSVFGADTAQSWGVNGIVHQISSWNTPEKKPIPCPNGLAQSSQSELAQRQKPPAPPANVTQGNYVVTNARRNSLIQTSGVGPCVVVTLYDPKSKTGAMVHTPSISELMTDIRKMYDQMKAQGVRANSIQANITGGWKDWRNSEAMQSQAKSLLKQLGVTISQIDPPINTGYNQEGLPTGSAVGAGAATRGYILNLNTGTLSTLHTP
jgi:hypothetical protein